MPHISGISLICYNHKLGRWEECSYPVCVCSALENQKFDLDWGLKYINANKSQDSKGLSQLTSRSYVTEEDSKNCEEVPPKSHKVGFWSFPLRSTNVICSVS